MSASKRLILLNKVAKNQMNILTKETQKRLEEQKK